MGEGEGYERVKRAVKHFSVEILIKKLREGEREGGGGGYEKSRKNCRCGMCADKFKQGVLAFLCVISF